MFNAKQIKLMNILGIVSESEREVFYEGYCEVACEMASEGMNAGTFAEYLERRIAFKALMEKRKAQKQTA
jgi:hypothetical protein